MGRYAVIDIGTNSVKLYVARVVHGRVTPLDDRLAVTRLGEGLAAAGELSEAAMTRTVAKVREYRDHACGLGAEKIAAVGTEALRRAANAREFVDLARRRGRVSVKILAPTDEARLSFLAVRDGLPDLPARIAVIDAGGGSTEFVEAEGERPLARTSVPLGSRTLTDALVDRDPPGPDVLAALRREAASRLADLAPPRGEVIAIGGTPTTLAAVALDLERYDPAVVHGTTLYRERISALAERFAAATLAERRRIPGLPPERADVVLAGAAILEASLERCGAEALRVCARGLRHGVFRDRFVAAGREGD